LSLAGLPGPSSKDLGPRFNLVSLLPTTALVLFVLVLVQTGAASGRPDLDRLAPSQVLGQGQALANLAYISAAVIVVSLVLYPFQLSLVRAYEGYWGRSAAGRVAGAIGQERQRRRRQVLELRQDMLADEDPHLRTVKTTLDTYFPDQDRLLPTRLGNVLRAAEDRAGDVYGLDAVELWPWLYPHVASPYARALDETRSQLDTFVRLSLALLLASLVAVAMLLTDGPWLLVPAATAFFAWLSYQAAVRTALKYGKSIYVAVDLYRFDMLRGLHFRLPDTLDEERKFNEQLMQFFDAHRPLFGSPAEHRYQHRDDETGQATAACTVMPGWMRPVKALWQAVAGAWRRRTGQGRSP
jgi:hypothetical protein